MSFPSLLSVYFHTAPLTSRSRTFQQISDRLQPVFEATPQPTQRRLEYSIDSVEMLNLSEIDPPFHLESSISDSSDSQLENISSITIIDVGSDSMAASQSDRAILLEANAQQQQQIAGLHEEVELLEEQLQERDALERDGNLAQYAVEKSVRATNRHKELRNRVRALQGLPPLTDTDSTEDSADYRTPEVSFTGGEWPVSPIAASFPVEQLNAIEAYDRSLDNVLKYANEARQRPIATDEEEDDSESHPRSYHESDFFNKNIIGDITTSEEEAEVDLWHEEESAGQAYLDVTPGILDDSLYEDQPAEALIKEPVGFVRRRYPDLLNESDMAYDDIFGDEAEEVVLPSDWQVSRPTQRPVPAYRSSVQPQRSPIQPESSVGQSQRYPIQTHRSPARPLQSPVHPQRSPVRPQRSVVQLQRNHSDLLNESDMAYDDIFDDEVEEMVLPSNWQVTRRTPIPILTHRSPEQPPRSPTRPQSSVGQSQRHPVQQHQSPVQGPLHPQRSLLRPQGSAVQLQPMRSPAQSQRSSIPSQRIHYVDISSTESQFQLSAEEEPFLLSDSSPNVTHRSPARPPTHQRSMSQYFPEDQSWLEAQQMTYFQSPAASESIKNRKQYARALYIPADPAVRRQLFAAEDSGTVIDSDDDELPQDQRNFVWLERMVPMTGDPRRVEIILEGQQRGRQRRPPRQGSTDRRKSSRNRSTERRTTPQRQSRQDHSGSRGRSTERQTDWQPPPPKVITPRMAKAIAVNKAFMEEKKRKRLASSAARQPAPPVEVPVETEAPPEPAPTETELLIEKLRKRMRRAQGDPETPAAAGAAPGPIIPQAVPQTLPLRMQSRSKSVGLATRSDKFQFDLTSPQHRRAVEVNRAYEEELQRKRPAQSAKKGAVKSVPGRITSRAGSRSVAQKYLELTEAQHARAVEVNRLHEEEQEKKKQKQKERANAQKERANAAHQPKTQLQLQQPEIQAEAPGPSLPKPVDIVQQLRKRMWAKRGKPALSDGDEDLEASLLVNEDPDTINGLPRDRHARAIEINRRFEEEQKLKQAKWAAKRTKSLPSSRRSKREQPLQPAEFKFELTAPQFARSLEVNRLYEEQKRLKKEKLEARKAKLRAEQAALEKILNAKKLARAMEVNRVYEEEHREAREREKQKKSASVGAPGRKRSKPGLRSVPATDKRSKYRELTSPQHRRAIEVNELHLAEQAEKQARVEAKKAALRKELLQAGSRSERKGTTRQGFLTELDAERKARAIEVNRMFEEATKLKKQEKDAKRAGLPWPPVPTPQPEQEESEEVIDPIEFLRRRLIERREQYVPTATETLGHNPFAAVGPHTGVPTARELWKTPEPKTPEPTPPSTPEAFEPAAAAVSKTATRRARIPLARRSRRSDYKFDLTSPQHRRALEVNRMYEEAERLKKEAKERKRTQSVGPARPARSKSGQSQRGGPHQRALSVGRGLNEFRYNTPKMDRALRVQEIYMAQQAAAVAKKEEAKKRRAEKLALNPPRIISSRFKVELNPTQHARALEVNRLHEEEQRSKAEEKALRDSKRTKSLGLPPAKRSRHRPGQMPVTERKKPVINLERNEMQRARAIEVNRQFMETEKLKKQKREARRAGLPWPPVPLPPPQPEPETVVQEAIQHGPMVDYLLQRIALAPPIRQSRVLKKPRAELIRPQGMQLESTPPRVEVYVPEPPRIRTPIPTPPPPPPPPPRDRRAQAIEINEIFMAKQKLKKQQERKERLERLEREELEGRPRSQSFTRRRRTTSNYL